MNNQDSIAIDVLIAKLKKENPNIKSLESAIYARKSTKDESQVSLESQIASCRNYIKGDKRLHIAQIYSEDNISGYHIAPRKEFNKLLNDVRKGKIRVIVYYSVDREARNTMEGCLFDQECKKLGVLQLYSTQSFDDNANGRFIKTVVRANGQREVEEKSEKACDIMYNSLAKARRATGATCPFGYKVVENHYVLDEKEAPVVKLMFTLAASGLTTKQISNSLMEKGFLNRARKEIPQ